MNKKIVLLSMCIVVLTMFLINVSAWPMQLLPNNTIIDLGTNETINGTAVDFILFNGSLFLIPQVELFYNLTNITNVIYQNITNVTNVTYQNVTYTGNFTNYTTQNITVENHTNIYNGTGELVYTTTEIDNKLTTYVPGSAMSGYFPRGEIGAYALKTEINSGSYIGTGTFWTMIILIILIIGAIVYIIFTRDE